MLNMNDMDKLCEGCNIYEDYENGGKTVKCLPYTDNRMDCPCIKCLIKPMCLQACEEFRELCNEIRNK